MSGSISAAEPPLTDAAAAEPVAEIAAPDAATFLRDVAPRREPVVLRGLVADWPLVAAGRRGDRALAAYLAALDGGRPVNVFSAPPGQEGRFFYADDLRGLNFGTEQATLTQLLAALLELAGEARPPALYAGAAPAAENLVRFAADNPMPLPLAGAEPRVWVGNRSRIATHYDMSDNVACVAAGRRRFLLFPPGQVGNLHVGPLERTPAGQPVSMVDPLAPDLARHPRFAAAREHMLVADLLPGDAIHIPSLWWHHVTAGAAVNVLVNYWTRPAADGSPLAAMVHAIHAIRDLPDGERAAWRDWFDHYVFGDDRLAAAAHLPAHARGVLGPPSPDRDRLVKAYVDAALFGPG